MVRKVAKSPRATEHSVKGSAGSDKTASAELARLSLREKGRKKERKRGREEERKRERERERETLYGPLSRHTRRR